MSAKQETWEITFKDLAKLTDREIQMILREVDTKDLAVALQGATGKLNDRMFGNMSQRVGTLIREKMAFTSHVMRDVEAMQLHIVEIVKQLREAGQVARPRPTKKAPGRKPRLSKEYLAKKRAIRTTSKRPLAELSLNEINQMFVGLAEIARREGILALEKMIQGAGDKFLAAGVRLSVDGTEPELVQVILSTWMESLLHEQEVKYRKVVEGIMSIQSGDNPRIVEQKLNVLY